MNKTLEENVLQELYDNYNWPDIKIDSIDKQQFGILDHESPNRFPISVQIAQKTIAFDLVDVKPMLSPLKKFKNWKW